TRSSAWSPSSGSGGPRAGRRRRWRRWRATSRRWRGWGSATCRGARPCWRRRHVGRDGEGALPARGVSRAGDHPASREVNPRPGYLLVGMRSRRGLVVVPVGAAGGTTPTPHSRTDALSSPAAIVLVLLVFIPRLLSFEAFVHPLRARAGGVFRAAFREPWLVDGEAGRDAEF